MKKIILFISILVLAIGCDKKNDTVVRQFIKNVENAKAYLTIGTMEIYSDEDTFVYNLEASHKNEKYYKVVLVNKTNNHEQIILKNDDGVFVITPALNKSFKFQSEWPNNSSQSYFIDSLVKDMKKQDNLKVVNEEDKYITDIKVNYPNNRNLKYQKMYFDVNGNLKAVEVFDDTDTLKIKVNFDSIDFKPTFNDEYFKLENTIDEDCCSPQDQETGALNDIIYPLYVPSQTYLTGKNVVDIQDGKRVILTFGGEKSFVLVEEESTTSSEFEIIPVFGDPLLFNDSLAVVSANSISWSSNNIDYYLSSSSLTNEEMLSVANSLTNGESLQVGK